MTEPLFNPSEDIWEEDETIEETGKKRFYRARLFYPLRISFKKTEEGGTFTLPGVFYDKYDDEVFTRIGPKQFNGKVIDKNSKLIMAVWVKEFDDQHGNSSQTVVSMHNWNEYYNPEKEFDADDNPLSGKKPNLWLNLQKAEFNKLSKGQLNELAQAALNDKWAYCSSVDAATNFKGPFDKKTYDTEIVVYKSVEEWQQASEAHFAQFSQNGQSPVANYYPDDWGSAIEDMIKHGKELVEDNPSVDHKELATTLQLLVNGDPAQTADGEDCNVKRILAEVLDCPEPMVKI